MISADAIVVSACLPDCSGVGWGEGGVGMGACQLMNWEIFVSPLWKLD